MRSVSEFNAQYPVVVGLYRRGDGPSQFVLRVDVPSTFAAQCAKTVYDILRDAQPEADGPDWFCGA